MNNRLFREIETAREVGVEGFYISSSNFSERTLTVSYQCKPEKKTWKALLLSYLLAVKTHTQTPLAKLPTELIISLRSFLHYQDLELRVDIKFPDDYPYVEPSFSIPNHNNCVIPRYLRNVSVDHHFYGANFLPTFTLLTHYLPSIKKLCDIEPDEYETYGTYHCNCSRNSSICGPHRVEIYSPNSNWSNEYRIRVRGCGNPVNHYNSVMQLIPREFRDREQYYIMSRGRNVTERDDVQWKYTHCGEFFEVFLF
jgi:hypothetical protein